MESFIRIVKVSSAIDVVITDDFGLQANSQGSKDSQEPEGEPTEYEGPAGQDTHTKQLPNQDFTFRSIVVEDTVNEVEEGGADDTADGWGTEHGEEVSGVIQSQAVEQVGHDQIAGSSEEANDNGFPRLVVSGISSDSDGTSNEGSGDSGVVFSDGSSSNEKGDA